MTKKVEELLKAFYEGKTSPEEEHLLQNTLNKEANDDVLSDKELFEAMYGQFKEIPPEVSARLEATLHQLGNQEAIEQAPRLSLKDCPGIHAPNRHWIYWVSSAAATVLLCIGLFFADFPRAESTVAGTITDPEEASIIAGQALRSVSLNLNKGMGKMHTIQEEVQKTNEMLESSLLF